MNILVESDHKSESREKLNLLEKAAELTHHTSHITSQVAIAAGANCKVCFLENAPLHSFVIFC